MGFLHELALAIHRNRLAKVKFNGALRLAFAVLKRLVEGLDPSGHDSTGQFLAAKSF